MYITLTEEERNIVLEVAQEKISSEGISLEEALKDLLGIGLSHYKEAVAYKRWREKAAMLNVI